MKKKVDLITLWKLNKSTRTPFLGSSEFLSTFPFMNEYLSTYSRIDRDFIMLKGFMCPLWNNQYEDTNNAILAQFKEDVEDLILRNQNTYQRLYDLTKQEYNPIENYDRKETIHDVTKNDNTRTSNYGEEREDFDYGSKTTASTYGEQINNTTYGQRTEEMKHGAQAATTSFGAQTKTNKFGDRTQTDSHGAQSQTTSHGGHTDTHTIGAQTVNVTHQISGFNGGLVDESADSTNTGSRNDSDAIGSYTDKSQNESYTDTSKVTGYTDTESTAMHSDKTENAEYKDVNTISGYSDNTHISGHIDSVNEGAKTDSHKTFAKEDTHVDDGTSDYAHDARIHGNIGVTTTAQMIDGERQLWTAFNFYKVIYDDITKELCTFYDEGVDAFYAGLDNEEDDDMTIGNDQIRASVEQTPDGAIITITDSTGTSTAKISNGSNGRDGITPKFKVETDGDLYVDYSGESEVK